MTNLFRLASAALLLGMATPALADEADDVIKGGTSSDDSNKKQREDVEKGRVDTGPAPSAALPDDAEERGRRIIQTRQRKTFLKLNRWEASPQLGLVTNDPFINRYLVGVAVSRHITEVFALEATWTFSPDFGEGDWKPITTQLVNNNQVSPDISKIEHFGTFNFQYSPIYGKLAVVGSTIINFDIFAAFGGGYVNTRDDLTALQAEEDPAAMASARQFHPATSFGGGFRVIFSDTVAARAEARSLIYIETINSTTLEMKNNLLFLLSASVFFPKPKDS